MWLLDVNMPKRVASLLGEFGIKADSADDRGWGGLTNGALVQMPLEPDLTVCSLAIGYSVSPPQGR